MKKIITSLVLLLGLGFSSQAQYYYNTYNPAGMNPGGLNQDPEQPFGATGVTAADGYTSIIANGTTTLSWSPVQTIPFPFSFNGTPVTQYKVSNSGVLTFTTTATAVPPNANTTIPSASIPDNSVMVWGLEQFAGNDGVINKTHGTAPNRQHWINFASFSAPGASGSQWTYWGIVLEETTNNIYIADLRTYLTPLTLTLGIQINSTTAYSITGAPNTPSYVTNGGSASDPTDNVYYEFIQGNRPANDAKLVSTNIGSAAAAGTPFNITGTIQNAGSATINTLVLNWSIDNGVTVNSSTLSGLNLAPLATANFSHTIPWSPSNPGNFTDIKVWTSFVSPTVDGNPLNDTLSYNVFVNTGVSVQRKAVLEEFTTAVCQFCPDGAVVVEQVLAANPNVIGIGVHSCFNTDAMTNSASSGLCNVLGNNSAPTAMIDRIVYPGETSAAVSRTTWMARANARAAEGSPVGVTISGTYNPTTRATSVTINSNFVDYPLPGNLNLTLSILEDSVTGTGNGYNQQNAYNTQTGHPYAGKGNPIIGYIHRHVLRANFPNTFGDASVFPSTVAINTPYSKTYNFNMPTAWDASKISFVAMVNYAGPGVENYQILNAEEMHIGDFSTGIEKQISSIQSLELSPNPTADYSYLRFNLKENANVLVSVYDITGKLIQENKMGTLSKGKQQAIIDATTLENGFYLVNLKVGEEHITKKISVIH